MQPSIPTDKARGIKKWEVRQRLEFIENCLFWVGRVNRADLTNTFGISAIQASKDFRLYQDVAAGNMTYDGSGKFYQRTECFVAKFSLLSAEEYLNSNIREEGTVSLAPCLPENEGLLVEVVKPPQRRISPSILQSFIYAIRDKRDLLILYQSMSREESLWRWVTPHAFGHDGKRWHCRAFCHIDNRFKDFLLARALEIGESRASTIDPATDIDWQEYETTTIVPHPGLTPGQRQVVENDYGMVEGKLVICQRRASAFYLRKLLNLDSGSRTRRAEEQQIVLEEVPHTNSTAP